MSQERAPDDSENGNGAENPEAAAAAAAQAAAAGGSAEDQTEPPTFGQRVARRTGGRRGAAAAPENDTPENDTPESGEEPLVEQVAGEELTCAVCHKPIEGGYLQAAYGPVHTTPCAQQTKRVTR